MVAAINNGTDCTYISSVWVEQQINLKPWASWLQAREEAALAECEKNVSSLLLKAAMEECSETVLDCN